MRDLCSFTYFSPAVGRRQKFPSFLPCFGGGCMVIEIGA